MIKFLILLGVITFNQQPDNVLTITVKNSNLNYQKDSILYLNVSVNNLTDRKLIIPNIKNARPGMICSLPTFDFKITYQNPNENQKLLYGSPFAMCHLFKPDITIKKNEIINFPISIDFKHLRKGDSIFSDGENNNFGVYEIYLTLRSNKDKVYQSNNVTVIYNH